MWLLFQELLLIMGTLTTEKEKHSSVNRTEDDGEGIAVGKVDVDDILDFIGFGPLQIIAYFLAGLTSLAFGFETLVLAFIYTELQKQWNLDGLHYAVLPSVTGVTNIVGGFFYGYLSDNYGRVWPYALAIANVAVFSLVSAFSQNFATMITLRGITSFGITGIVSMLVPTLAEFLPVKNRGKVLILVFLIQAVGNCAAGGLAWWLIPTYTVNGWRYLVIATALPSFFSTLYRLVFFIESPRFLIAKGKFAKARKTLSLMARINGKNLNDFLPEEKEFQYSVSIETKTKETFLQSFSKFLTIFKPPYLKRTICLSIIYPTQTITYYASALFFPAILEEQLGINNPYFTLFIGYLGQIPGILLMAIVIEWARVGRLNSFRFFTLLSVVSFLLLAFVQTVVTIPVFMILIYFSLVPIIPLLYTYMSESYPTAVRTFALSFFNGLSAIGSIVMPFVSGYLSDVSIPWLYPTVWAGLLLFQFVVSLFLRRETLGINLTDTV